MKERHAYFQWFQTSSHARARFVDRVQNGMSAFATGSGASKFSWLKFKSLLRISIVLAPVGFDIVDMTSDRVRKDEGLFPSVAQLGEALPQLPLCPIDVQDPPSPCFLGFLQK